GGDREGDAGDQRREAEAKPPTGRRPLPSVLLDHRSRTPALAAAGAACARYLRKRERLLGRLSIAGKLLSGWSLTARLSRVSSDSRTLGSGRQHSTGHTAWQAS